MFRKNITGKEDQAVSEGHTFVTALISRSPLAVCLYRGGCVAVTVAEERMEELMRQGAEDVGKSDWHLGSQHPPTRKESGVEGRTIVTMFGDTRGESQ